MRIDILDTNIIDEGELEFIKKFRQSILEYSDPIAKLEKIKPEKGAITHRSQDSQYVSKQNDARSSYSYSIYLAFLLLFILFMIFFIQAFLK